MSQTSAPDRKVPTRRISFEESLQDLPRHFAADGDLILSHLAAALSSVFPDGEDFFVRSVRHYRDQITDPDLKRQVAGFIGQEAMHGREHRALNDRLDRARLPDQDVRAAHPAGPRPPRAGGAADLEPGRHRGARALHRHARRAAAVERRRAGAVRPRRDPQPLPLARARGVRAQGRRLRRLQGDRRQRAPAGVDDEVPHGRLHRRHDVPGRRLAARRRLDLPARRAAGQLAPVPPLADHAGSICGTSCATTTAPTSTPTTTTPPSWSSAGGPSCSAPRAR